MITITNLAYLVSAVFFIFGLKNLSSPKTARRGNLLAVIGMLIAIIVTLLDKKIVDFTYIIAGVIVGAAIGAVSAKKVQMTAMPQMVAIFNGFDCSLQMAPISTEKSTTVIHPCTMQQNTDT